MYIYTYIHRYTHAYIEIWFCVCFVCMPVYIREGYVLHVYIYVRITDRTV